MQGKENMGDFFDIIQGDSEGMVNILVIVRKKIYEQVSNSEW